MARENTQAEELYEVAALLLAVVKTDNALGLCGPKVKALIRRAEKATKARPQ